VLLIVCLVIAVVFWVLGSLHKSFALKRNTILLLGFFSGLGGAVISILGIAGSLLYPLRVLW
jgi:hypothetical protein